MYESPIDRVVNDIVTKMEQDRERIVMRCIHEEGINVDKNELIKALNYDRNQYKKGYSDGKNDVLDKIRAEIENASEDLDGYDPDSLPTYICRVYDIIDKYRKEGEEE